MTISVTKNKRKTSDFQVFKQLTDVRNSITELALRNFGYSKYKAQKALERKFGGKSYEELSEEQKEEYEKLKDRNKVFDEWFIVNERFAVTEFIREVGAEVYAANSIQPQYFEELVERRKHQDNAIGACHKLKNELNYIVDILPINVEKFVQYTDPIDEEINLIKGWRKSDNRLKKRIIDYPKDEDEEK